MRTIWYSDKIAVLVENQVDRQKGLDATLCNGEGTIRPQGYHVVAVRIWALSREEQAAGWMGRLARHPHPLQVPRCELRVLGKGTNGR